MSTIPSYLDIGQIPIARETLNVLYDILMVNSSLPIYEMNTDTTSSTITGTCSVYGINDASIEVKVSPTKGVALEISLSKSVADTFTVTGLDWLLLKNFQASISIPEELSTVASGTISAETILGNSIPLNGSLNQYGEAVFTALPFSYYWKFSSTELSSLNFTQLIPIDAPGLADFMNEVKGLVATVIKSIDVIFEAEKHRLVIHTPLSWNITDKFRIEALAVKISSRYDAFFNDEKDFAVLGTLKNNGQDAFDIAARFVKAELGTKYEIDVKASNSETLSVQEVIGDADVNEQASWLPSSWQTKLNQTSLERLSLIYATQNKTFEVDASGIFAGVAARIHFSVYKFFESRFFSFSADFYHDLVSITELFDNILDIDVDSTALQWLPEIKLGLQYVEFHQQSKSFKLSGPIELGETDPIKLQCGFELQWLDGINFKIDFYSFGAPLTLQKATSAIGLDFDYLKEIMPDKLIDKVLDTSFARMSLRVDNTRKEYAFFGAARLFGNWDVESHFRYTAQGQEKYFYFDASVNNKKQSEINLRELPAIVGFLDDGEFARSLIPDVSIFPEAFSFDQAQRKLAFRADWRFGNSLIFSDITFDSATDSAIQFFLKSDPNFPLSFLSFFSAVIPYFSAPDNFPLDVFIKEVDVTINPKSKIAWLEGKANGFAEILGLRIDLSARSIESSGESWYFSGASAPGQEIPLGRFISHLAEKFNISDSLPQPIKTLSLKDLATSFNTASKDFTFSGAVDFMINNVPVDVTAAVEITRKQDESFAKHFAGHIEIGAPDPLAFALIFDQDTDKTLMLAAYTDAAGKEEFDVGQLVNSLLPQPVLPSGLTITLNDALLAYESGTPSKTLFLVHIGNGINLSDLPLVGRLFPADQTIKLTYQIQYASDSFASNDVAGINQLLPENIHPLVAQELPKGVDLAVSLQAGADIIPFDLDLAARGSADDPDIDTYDTNPDGTAIIPPGQDPVVNTGADGSQGVKWFTLQKTFGPVHFERIGVAYTGGQLTFLLDASLSQSGLTISLDGLSVASPLTRFAPVFDLKGLGIDFKNDVLEVGAAFLREHVGDPSPAGYDEYDGLAILKMKQLSLSAIGSYAYVNGQPSLFIYAALNYPIGGPSFFFVTGISAGFGYNRALRMPTIDQVLTFPLVAEALNGQSLPDDAGKETLAQELEAIHSFIPPATGQMFIAAGISFTTFKLVDSTILLAASFGNRFELELLGVSTLTAPPQAGKTPLAFIELALRGAFIPEEGFVGLRGQLTPASHILSKDCHLTGGFAFYAWYGGEHAGDFVTTIGGYHPHFQKPAHYPAVPRLAFNWQLDRHTHIKGDVYFALCSHALMAGGHLEAVYKKGALKAWFKAGADFLVAWKPYHYEASLYLNIGGSYTYHFFGTHHITVDVGADVNIWGPEFGGHATVHLYICSVKVDFGARRIRKPDPISWETFQSSFLPEEKLCNVTVSRGLVSRGSDAEHLGVVNPKDLALVTDAFIPSKVLTTTIARDPEDTIEWTTDFGIGSMNIATEHLSCTQTITVERHTGSHWEDHSSHFKYRVHTKKAPAGMWGTQLTPKVNDPQFIDNALSGLAIVPGGEPMAGGRESIDRDFIKFETSSVADAIEWGTREVFAAADLSDSEAKAKINRSIKDNAARDALLAALGIREEIDLTDSMADDYTVAPLVEAAEVG